MNKETALNELITKIYNYTGPLIISKKDIKKLEEYYIKHANNYNNVNDFMNSDQSIKALIDKLKSGKDEIDKQLRCNKALQPAILAECVFIQTLAKILGLRSYLDLERANYSSVPSELSLYVKPSSDTICAARYVYYNKNNLDTFLIQYGNPKAGDAAAVLYRNEIIIEIKDMPALLMDTDLLYDENGKLIVPDNLRSSYPNYAKYIDMFNKKTSVIDEFGSNYKLFNAENNNAERLSLLKGFFDASNVDVVITAVGINDDLIAIKSSDIDFVFPDGSPLIYTAGSEIRTTGKNSRSSAFTPQYLEQVLHETGVTVDENEICKVYHNNTKIIGTVHGRGKDKTVPTRLKISHAFFVKMENVIEYDDRYEFSKSKIHQSKSGVSLHIEIKKSKKEIKKDLYVS